jgi:hypothetical protein
MYRVYSIYTKRTWLCMRPMTPPPERCPFHRERFRPPDRTRASTAVGAASMRTSHPRSVVLGACLYCRWRSLHAHLTPSKRRVGRVPLLPLAQPPCAPHTLEASCWARASTAVGAASMRTSHLEASCWARASTAVGAASMRTWARCHARRRACAAAVPRTQPAGTP